MQGLPLDIKIAKTKLRIQEWYEHWNGEVYVSFSGGKDSTVLLHLVRELYPDVPAVFVNTGLEYPEIREFVKSIDNVVWIKPKMRFDEVIKKYGYPVISKEVALYIREIRESKAAKLINKRWNGVNGQGKLPLKYRYLVKAPFKISDKCCSAIKKSPLHSYEKETKNKSYTGTMASESRLRVQRYLKVGCNAFENSRPSSTPIAFWKEKDIWEYIRLYKIPYSKIYDMGHKRTGCMFCMFGVHLENQPNRFQLMAKTHPKLYDYCINKLGCGKIMDYIGVDYTPSIQKKLFEVNK
jgi:3'-phosphoadenosine 5'-phosphosulfate sulfotransferase (PAPS reductase)/FAD synthetase